MHWSYFLSLTDGFKCFLFNSNRKFVSIKVISIYKLSARFLNLFLCYKKKHYYLSKQENKKHLFYLRDLLVLTIQKSKSSHQCNLVFHLWAELDSNQRRRCRRIYSPLPLTTRSSTLYAHVNSKQNVFGKLRI